MFTGGCFGMKLANAGRRLVYNIVDLNLSFMIIVLREVFVRCYIL